MQFVDSVGPDRSVHLCSLIWTFSVCRHILQNPPILNSLCWGLTTHQPLWVILCHLPEKRRRDRRGDEREGQGRKRRMNESEQNK